MIKRERAQRKPSLGIALCRRDPETQIPQILLVRSRITYSFSGFVFGKYKPWDSARLAELVGAMTPEEKLLVWGCNFSRLWYHIWQKIPDNQPTEMSATDTFYQFYINSRTKFERLIQRDNGRRLRAILTATGSGELGWDIPGGKAETDEKELETAQRELREEAGVVETDYHLLEDVRPICNSFEDDNATYVRKYYVAWTDKKLDPRLNYSNLSQVGEVSAVRWFGLREMSKIVAQNRCLRDQVRLALTLFKRRVRV
jgi:8-oxo-dGTP pyrophosphatase MutT (NUDIX family)